MTIFNAKHILELFKQNDNFSLDTVSGWVYDYVRQNPEIESGQMVLETAKN